MSEYFNYDDITNARIADIEAHDPAILNAKMPEDLDEAVKLISSLLTYMPEEKRDAAVRSFIAVMLVS